MKKALLFAISFAILSTTGLGQTPQEKRVAYIQVALQKAKLDGWLFYDFRGSDILAPRILNTNRLGGSRRWYYYVPATGEPTKIVHAIEQGQLDSMPGKKLIYREWQLINSNLKQAIASSGRKPRIAMEYSPNNDIPYIARVDAGTIEMIRSLGIDVVTSADLVQQFEAVWTPEQFAMHKEAAEKLQATVIDTFAEIKRRINENVPMTELDIQRFMMKRLEEKGVAPDPMNVSVNAHAASPHYFPNERMNAPIKLGDLVLIDATTS